tara:strand:+ start:1758 stop:2099 length:342 start_codon:yes stop_codon:yes gene_type:complete
MADIINFGVERAKRKSGIKNNAMLEEMVKEGYDPCNPKDIQDYEQWQTFKSVIYKDVDLDFKWSDEAVDRLWTDIMNFDTNETVTVDYDIEEFKELVISTDDDMDFTHLLPEK